MLRISACGLDAVQINTSESSFEQRQLFFNAVLQNLEQAKLSWLIDVVVCEYSMTVQYECAQVRYQEVKAYLKKVVRVCTPTLHISMGTGVAIKIIQTLFLRTPLFGVLLFGVLFAFTSGLSKFLSFRS